MGENMSPNGKKQAVEEKVEEQASAKAEEPKTAAAKRPSDEVAVSGSAEEPKRLKTLEEETVIFLDVATDPLGLEAGDRVEVEFEVTHENETRKHWWGATLLEFDGRTMAPDEEDDNNTSASIAIRVLDYDPYPEGGFPERSKEDVVFIRNDTLLNPQTHEELHFRIISTDNSAVMMLDGRGGIEDLVNTVLTSAMEKASKNWASLPAAQQALMAEKVAEKKEKLIELLHRHSESKAAGSIRDNTVTADDVKMLLEKTMAED